LQSSVIKAVNDIGQPVVAIRFAEEYQVFDKLVEIIQPTQSSAAMEKADYFSEKYGESFIKILFDWFITTGMYRFRSYAFAHSSWKCLNRFMICRSRG
jgi:hypothetical protein